MTDPDEDAPTRVSKLTHKTSQFDKMMTQGAFRKKQGVVKNDQQMKFYHKESDSKEAIPKDLIDFYLEERFNIHLGQRNAAHNATEQIM